MNLALYRYGEAANLPGLAVGVARHPPRGVKREELAARGYYDVALPLLAPSRELVASYRGGELTFAGFARAYRREMGKPEVKQVMRLVAAVARTQRVNLGCFCEDENRCHRSVLRDLIEQEAAESSPAEATREVYSSPACSMPEIED